MKAIIHHGDCLDILPTLDENSVDAIICDPPYHLTKDHGRRTPGRGGIHRGLRAGFMLNEWDGGDLAFQPEVWAACLRVLKPGGHMCAFGSARTHHRIWTAIEDGGFELRDCLMWLHSQGYPKSHDIAKAIQTRKDGHGARYDNRDLPDPQPVPLPGNLWIEGAAISGMYTGQQGRAIDPEALAWDGWNVTLKPSYEPICLARKPLGEKSITENVLKYGTGGLHAGSASNRSRRTTRRCSASRAPIIGHATMITTPAARSMSGDGRAISCSTARMRWRRCSRQTPASLDIEPSAVAKRTSPAQIGCP